MGCLAEPVFRKGVLPRGHMSFLPVALLALAWPGLTWYPWRMCLNLHFSYAVCLCNRLATNKPPGGGRQTQEFAFLCAATHPPPSPSAPPPPGAEKRAENLTKHVLCKIWKIIENPHTHPPTYPPTDHQCFAPSGSGSRVEGVGGNRERGKERLRSDFGRRPSSS